MASDITEVDQFDATVAAPDDGDTANRASLVAALTGLQALANRTLYNNNRLLVPSSGIVQSPIWTWTDETEDVTHWQRAFSASGDTLSYWNQEIVAAWELVAPLPQLTAGTITAVTMYLNPLTGRGGLPAIMPKIDLRSIAPATSNTITNHGTITDSSASVGAYEVHHAATGAVSIAVDPTRVYWLSIEGESSTNSQTDAQFYGASVTVTF